MIFTECVLAYIEQQYIDAFISFVSSEFPAVSMLDYDMVNPSDPFGKMMLHNFKQRGIPLVGMSFFTSIGEIKKHYEEKGFTTEIHTMREMYYQVIDQDERKRIERLEFLDELEEFYLVQEHYFMSLSTKVVPPCNQTKAKLMTNIHL